MRQPDETEGRETQCAYVIVADCDAHYARAKKAGAAIVRDIQDEDYGGRGYTCRDPEGHIWNFGSYDPWAETTLTISLARWTISRAAGKSFSAHWAEKDLG